MQSHQYAVWKGLPNDSAANLAKSQQACLEGCALNKAPVLAGYTVTLNKGAYKEYKRNGIVLPYTCNSADWWYNSASCHFSYGTSCDGSPGIFRDKTWNEANGNNAVNYYEKFCVCKLDQQSLSNKVYDYGVSDTSTKVYDYTQWVTEKDTADCPIINCKVLMSDCKTPLPSPYDKLIYLDSTKPWALRLSQTDNQGYPDYTICYQCNNEVEEVNAVIKIRQKMNCAISFDDQAFLPVKEVYNYQGSPANKAFSYTDSSKIFSNSNFGDCGGITNCYLRAQGCVNAYTGYATMDPTTYALSARQNIDPGYFEYVCVVCENSGGGNTGTLGNNWIINQKMNCATALQAASKQLQSKKIAYSSSGSLVTQSTTWKDFFINNDPRKECPSDSAVTCQLLAPGCLSPYKGTLTINSATGKIESLQNVDNGYNETVCIQCTNGVGGSVINHDGWNVEQTSNCALATVKIDGGVNLMKYDFLYRSYDYVANNIRYRVQNIDYLKSLWDIEKVHCQNQIQSFEFYGQDNKTLLISNLNETIRQSGSEISITTEYFNRSNSIFLRNAQQYGATSRTQTIELRFNVSGCDLVGMDFNRQAPDENPRNQQYRFYNSKFPYLYQYSQNISTDPSASLEHNMTETFVSEDWTNCPCVEYKIEQVKGDWIIDNYFGFQFSMNNSGFFKIANYQSYHKFRIWISCVNPAGVYSGMSEYDNINLEWEKPFVAPNLPPSFKGTGVEGQGSGFTQQEKDPETGLTGLGVVVYEPIYNNRTNYTEPKQYPDRRLYTFTFPAVQDPEDEKIELKVISTVNESQAQIRINSNGLTEIIFNKENIPFDKALNLSSGGNQTYQITTWLSLEDSFGNIVYRFLKVIFIKPADLTLNNFNGKAFGDNNIRKNCGNEILTANITKIDREGLVNITYSQVLYSDMFEVTRLQDKANKIPRWLEHTSYDRRDEKLTKQLDGNNKTCFLWKKVPEGSMNLTDLNTTQLEMYIKPYNNRQWDEGFNISKLNFTWEIVYYRWEYVLVQLEFEAPNYISTEIVWDQFFFRVKENYTNHFYSPKIDNEIDENYWKLTHPIRPQTDQSNSLSYWITWLAKFFKIVLKFVFWACVISNLLFGGSMRWFFTLIRTLQIVLHLPMVRIIVPTCVIYSYSIIIPIAKFDVFENLILDPKNFLKKENQVFNRYGIYQQMQLLGYDSKEALENLGSLTFFIVVYIFKIAFLAVIKIVRNTYGNGEKFHQTYISLKRSLFWFELYIIIIEPYFEYLIAAYFQFGYTYEDQQPLPMTYDQTTTYYSKQEVISHQKGHRRELQVASTASAKTVQTTDEIFIFILLFLCVGVMPVVFVHNVLNNINLYQRGKFYNASGNLYEDIDLRSKWSAAFYLVFIIRRIIFVSIVFSIDKLSSIQLLVINLCNLAMLIYIGANRPLIGRFAQRLEMFNEIMVCFISFHMYFFTDWVLDSNNQTDKDLQYQYGISMNCFITYYIYANLMVICYYTFQRYWLTALRWARIFRYRWFGLRQEEIVKKPMNKLQKRKKEDPIHVRNSMMMKLNISAARKKYKIFYRPHFYKLAEQTIGKPRREMSIIQEEPETSRQVVEQPKGFAAFMDKMQEQETQPVLGDGFLKIQHKRMTQRKSLGGINFAAFMDKLDGQKDTGRQDDGNDQNEIGRDEDGLKQGDEKKGKINFGAFMDDLQVEDEQNNKNLQIEIARDEDGLTYEPKDDGLVRQNTGEFFTLKDSERRISREIHSAENPQNVVGPYETDDQEGINAQYSFNGSVRESQNLSQPLSMSNLQLGNNENLNNEEQGNQGKGLKKAKVTFGDFLDQMSDE